MSRFTELSNNRGRFSWRSQSQPPLNEFASTSGDQGSPTFLNTESNQQIDDASLQEFCGDAYVRSTVVRGEITGVRTLSSSTLANVVDNRQRQLVSGLAATSSPLGYRPRLTSRSGRNDTPCRSFRSAFNQNPISDTIGAVSSSSSSNSIIGRYRSMSGADGTETGVDAHLQQIPLPHMIRLASLRMDSVNTHTNDGDVNRPVREQAVLLDRPRAEDEIEEDVDTMHMPSLVNDDVANYCGDFPPISCGERLSKPTSSELCAQFVVSQSVQHEHQSAESGSVFRCTDACQSSVLLRGSTGAEDGESTSPQPFNDAASLQLTATNRCEQSEPNQTIMNSELDARNHLYPFPPTLNQPLIRFPNRRQSSSRNTSVTNPSQEPEADHDFIRTSELISLPHRCDAHSPRLLTGLDQLRRTGYFCDVVLQVGSTKLPAHRNVLASCSQYFYAMFTGGMCEAASPYVQIQGIDADTLAKLLDFIYTGEISVSEDSVETLLPAANILQLTSVRDACCEFLQSQLHPSNCLGIQRFADMHNCTELLSVSRRYTEQHFGELLEQDEEFLALPTEQVLLLISSDRLAVSEVQVFEAVLRWIDHDPQRRQTEARCLCGRVRFSLLPREYLVRLSQSERFLSTNPWCKDYLIEALSYHLLSWDQKLRVTSERAKPRTPVGLPKVLLVMGGQAPKAIRSVEYLEFRTGVWHCSKSSAKESHQHAPFTTATTTASTTTVITASSPIGPTDQEVVSESNQSISPLPTLPSPQPVTGHQQQHYSPVGSTGSEHLLSLFEPGNSSSDAGGQSTVVDLPSRRCRFGVAVVGGLVYVVGGFNGALRVRSVEVYDPVRNTWHSGPNMECRRATLGVAVLNGHIYAVGGFDGSSGLNSAEVFDFWSDSWHFIAPLSCRRSSVGAATLNGMVYAVGGYDGVSRRCLSSVECYDPVNNTWSPAAELTCRRSGPAVCELNDRIYAVGGHDGPIVRNTAEVYSPKSNVWQRIADLNVPRRNAGIVVYDGCLYVVGGENGEINLSSVEKYDVSSNTWVLLPSLLNIGRSYAGCTVIERPMP